MITINPDQIRKILIRGVNWIGDAVLTTPTLSAIRSEFPDAAIHLLAKEPIAELLRRDPNIDRIMIYDIHGRHGGPLGKLKLVEEIKKESFDMAILLQNAFEAALIAFLSGIPIRYGYDTDGRGSLLNLLVPCKGEILGHHQIDYYLNLLKPISSREYKREPMLGITGEEEAWAEEFLRRAGCLGMPVVGINPGSTYGHAKRWPAERFASLSDILIKEYNARVIIFGGPGEKEVGSEISGLMKEMPLDLSGKTSIRELMALIRRCYLFITNDSGPMHIAAAFNVPIVAIFGPTDHKTTSPFGEGHIIIRKGVECAPCLLRECPSDHECMESIMVDEVADAVDKLIRRKKSCDETMSQKNRRDNENQPLPTSPLNKGEETSSPSLVKEGVRGSWGGFWGERRRRIAVFIDRDGTINKESGYIDRPDMIELVPGSAEAIKKINSLGLSAVVVTNQSGIGRSYFSEESLGEIHSRLKDILKKEGAYIDAIYYCPHHPDEGCECRKPMPGLLRRAASELDIDLCSSYVVGDKISDLILAKNINAKGILVKTGYGSEAIEAGRKREVFPDLVAEDLLSAVRWIEEDIKKY